MGGEAPRETREIGHEREKKCSRMEQSKAIHIAIYKSYKHYSSRSTLDTFLIRISDGASFREIYHSLTHCPHHSICSHFKRTVTNAEEGERTKEEVKGREQGVDT